MTAGPAVLPQAQSAPSQASHAELEQEPDAAATDSDDKSATKIDLKNIKVTPFDRTVKEGSFDAKAREFREELDEQINDAQVLAGQTWTDAVRKVAFKMFLTGMARRWLREWLITNPAATYSDMGDALEHEFRPVLLGTDIVDRIKKERKRWYETYREAPTSHWPNVHNLLEAFTCTCALLVWLTQARRPWRTGWEKIS
jgi:hypothetical protein